MKEIILTTVVRVQEQGTNMFSTLPATVRSILKPNKGDELEYVIYDDKSIGLRMKKAGD